MLPGKHLALAMGIKLLTGSKSGNCASDETIRRLDMELELAADYDEKNAPNEILLDPHLCTGTAWDNFDINIETLSGADTMHHTFGICYQNSLETTSSSSTNSIITKKSKKRSFEKVISREQEDIPPCTKKPKMSSFDFPATIFKEPPIRFTDTSPKQIVHYMNHIRYPPTRNDVVKETMVRSQQVSKKCKQRYTIVTYDLALAKIAKKNTVR